MHPQTVEAPQEALKEAPQESSQEIPKSDGNSGAQPGTVATKFWTNSSPKKQRSMYEFLRGCSSAGSLSASGLSSESFDNGGEGNTGQPEAFVDKFRSQIWCQVLVEVAPTTQHRLDFATVTVLGTCQPKPRVEATAGTRAQDATAKEARAMAAKTRVQQATEKAAPSSSRRHRRRARNASSHMATARAQSKRTGRGPRAKRQRARECHPARES